MTILHTAAPLAGQPRRQRSRSAPPWKPPPLARGQHRRPGHRRRAGRGAPGTHGDPGHARGSVAGRHHRRRIVYYIAQVASVALRARCGLLPWRRPSRRCCCDQKLCFAPGEPAHQPVIVVSRSGTTTEALDVIRLVQERGGPAIAVTCRPQSPMARRPRHPGDPEGDEAAIVMTRSFASQTALLMRLGARLGEAAFAADLDALPGRWPELAPSSRGPSSWQHRTPHGSWCWAEGLPTAWPTKRS